MSRPHRNFNVPNPEIGVDQYPPLSAQNQASPGVSNFVDGSGHIFSMYLEMATEEDKKMAEDRKADADGILIFTGLFSAAVASLLSVSIQDLRQNPQDISNFYLANIYQATINPTGSNISDFRPASPPPFSPPNSAVWVNALWFLSLVISLTCALLAALLQQWSRRYLKVTQTRYSLHKRARIRAFFSEGVDKRLLPWAVDALPTLLHVSLFLFFAGLVVFLCSVNLTIFKLVLSWVGLCTALYGFITCMPIIRHDSPYYTPLSLPTWHIVTGILFFTYRFLRWFTSVLSHYDAFHHFRNMEKSYHKSLVQGMQKTAEETALNAPSEIDTRAFMWTFDCLDEDHKLERFFSGLPGFRSSNIVDDPLPDLTEEQKWKFYMALRELLDHTFSSDLLPAPVKNRRALICAKAVDPEHTPNAFILHAVLFKCQHNSPVATAVAKILRGCGNIMDQDNIFDVQIAISRIIAARQPFDDSWYIFASNQLGISATSLRHYAAQGDNLSLVILIHLVRQQLNHFKKSSWSQRYDFSFLLDIAAKSNVKDTSPELQYEFCALWNQIVNTARDGNDREIVFFILRRIRNVFLALHQDTNSAPTYFSASTDDGDVILRVPSSYPVCKVPDHCSDLIPNIHDDVALTTIPRAIPHDPHNTVFVPSLNGPDLPSWFTHAPLSVDGTFTDALPFDKQISIPSSTQPIGQTMTESCRFPTTSLSPVTACTAHRIIDHTSRIMHLSASEPSTPGPPPKSNVSASLLDDVAVGRTELCCAPSDNRVRSSSFTPVLDRILPTESHSSIPATNASTKAVMEDDASDSTLEDIAPTADIPFQLPSPSPVADEVIEGPSTRSLGTEHIEHHPLVPMHNPYDIVKT